MSLFKYKADMNFVGIGSLLFMFESPAKQLFCADSIK